MFIVLEGPDRSGKSTQAKKLVAALRRRGRAVVHTREPGGTPLAEALRKIILNTRHPVTPLAELLLFEVARAQHTADKLRPALRSGKTVVSERYTLATEVYQGAGRGLDLKTIRTLNRIATGGLEPDLTLVLDIRDGIFKERDKHFRRDRIEREAAGFRRKVREGYRRLAKSRPRTHLIDASRPLDVVHADILARVLGRKRR